MLKEFKEFALKGNVIDMAVGIIIGGAFGKLVTSVVNDLIMPILGFLTAGVDFSHLKLVLSPATIGDGGVVIKPEAAILYGNFIQTVVDFIIIAFSIFITIRLMNKLRTKQVKATETEATPAKPTEQELLTEIRDLLADRRSRDEQSEL